MDGDDVGMGQAGHRLGLASESTPPVRIFGDPAQDRLERPLGVQIEVMDQVNTPQAARPEGSNHAVLAEQDRPLGHLVDFTASGDVVVQAGGRMGGLDAGREVIRGKGRGHLRRDVVIVRA